ncbi:MAG: DUF4260 domain-containing protein [Gemmatimonadota bacterium]
METRPLAARWLRAEGAAALVLSLALYAGTGASWWLYAALFLAPDLAMLGYLAGPRPGALLYNAAHTYVLPLLLAVAGGLAHVPVAVPVALVWVGHIGFDRMLGYGLKERSGFRDTHLGRIGGRR